MENKEEKNNDKISLIIVVDKVINKMIEHTKIKYECKDKNAAVNLIFKKFIKTPSGKKLYDAIIG